MIYRIMRMVAAAVVDELVARSIAQCFPTEEDIAAIRDHVSPDGVSFKNGRVSGRRQLAREVLTWWDEVRPIEGLSGATVMHMEKRLIEVLTRSGEDGGT